MQARDSIYISEIKQSFSLKDTASLSNYLEEIHKLPMDKYREYCQVGLEAAEELKDENSILNFCSCLSRVSYKLSDTIYFFQSIEIAQNMYARGDTTKANNRLALDYNQLGTLYSNHDMYYRAITYYHKSINYFKKTDMGYEMALASIGYIYSRLEDYAKAIDYYEETIFLLEENIDTVVYHRGAYRIYMQMAFCYSNMGDKDLAEEQIHKEEFHFQIISDLFSGDSPPKGMLGIPYAPFSNAEKYDYYRHLFILNSEEKVQMKWSKEELLEKLMLYKDTNEFTQKDYSYVALSVAIANNNIKKAKEHFEKSANYLTNESHSLCAKYYELIGDYPKALICQRKEMEQEKERLNSLRQKQIIFADTEYQSKQKELEIVELEQEREKQIYRSRLLLFGIGSLLLALFSLFFLLRQRAKQRKLLEQDITNKEIIIQQSNELAKTDVLRQRMFTNVAHELRTPLTFIKGALKQLKKNATLTASSEASINRVLFQSKEIEQMVEQIMALSKNEVQKLQVGHSKFVLADLNNHLNNTYATAMLQKDIQFIITPSPIDLSFNTDVEKLLIILKNLISNALKYTSPGGKISMNSQIIEGKLHISIEDTGRGIAPIDLVNIFDRFYQAKEGDIKPEGGFGIGLAICKEYVQLLGGNIVVESELGKRSKFILELPFIQESPNKLKHYSFPLIKSQPLATTKDSSIPEGNFILVVDDNVEMCAYLREILEKEHAVVTAHNGREALKIMHRRVPSLIVTDLMMPIMDGMRFAQRVKENSLWSAIPILILTAKNNVLEELKANRIGVDDYLMKPFDEEELKAHLYHLLELSEERLQPKSDSILEKNSLDSMLQTSLDEAIQEGDRKWLQDVEAKLYPLINDYNLDVNRISEELDMSASHVTRKMKAVVGLTPKKYITELRLLSGRKMLEKRTHNSVKAVAYSVGFKSDKTFSRNFKTRFGKYPSEYLN